MECSQFARGIDHYLRSAGAGLVVQYYAAGGSPRFEYAECKKAAGAAFFAKCRLLLGFAGRLAFRGWGRCRNNGFFCRTRITLLEFVDTASRIHDFVFAGVKRM